MNCFSLRVKKNPDNIALVYGGDTLTYSMLDSFIQPDSKLPPPPCLGVHAGDRVAVWASQSLYRWISVLGVLKSGAAYMPIDPALPLPRIKYMLTDGSVQTVISEKGFHTKSQQVAVGMPGFQALSLFRQLGHSWGTGNGTQ